MSELPDWRERIARRERIERDVRAQPECVLDILVAARGGALSRVRDESDWGLQVSCEAWKPAGGELRRSRLALLRRGTREELAPWLALSKALACLRVQARLLEHDEMGAPHAWVEKPLGPSDDAELAAVRVELTRPVVIEDPDLGPLTLDRRFAWYQGEIEWCGRKLRLTVSPDDPDRPEAALAVARALLADAETWRARIEDYAVEQLLDLKNRTWLDDDEEPVDAAGFKSRMTLTTLGVREGGGFSFWHDDGDLFWGHSILIEGDLESGPTGASIPG